MHRIVTGPLDENCYVVSIASGDAVVVDPGDDADRIAAYLKRRRLDLRGILITHAHDDHLAAAGDVSELTGAAVHLHSADAALLRRANLYRVFGRREDAIRIPTVGVDLAGRTILRFGLLQASVLHTPGHTLGSVCFGIGADLFTGDTVLADHTIQTNLPEEDRGLLAASHEAIAASYPPDTVLRPGHGESTSLARALSAQVAGPEPI